MVGYNGLRNIRDRLDGSEFVGNDGFLDVRGRNDGLLDVGNLGDLGVRDDRGFPSRVSSRSDGDESGEDDDEL